MSIENLIAKYSATEAEFFESAPSGATDAEIEALAASVVRNDLALDPAYYGFLKIRNGVSFNGLMLYGAEVPKEDPFMRLDLIMMNEYHFNRGQATVLGTSDLDVYVVAGPGGPFRRLDRGSWDVIDSFSTCAGLLESIFTQHLARTTANT